MNQFKFKPDKIKYLSNVDTLDGIHKKTIGAFNSKKANIDTTKKLLDKYTRELEKLEAMKSSINAKTIDDENNSFFTKTPSNKDLKSKIKINPAPNYIEKRTKILKNIQTLNEELNNIQTLEEETEYYAKTYDILFNYYDMIDAQLPQEIDNDHEIKTGTCENTGTNTDMGTNTGTNISTGTNTNQCIENIDPNVELLSDTWNFDSSQIFNIVKSNHLDRLSESSKKKRKEKKTTRKRIRNIESLMKDNNYNILDLLNSGKNSNEPETGTNAKTFTNTGPSMGTNTHMSTEPIDETSNNDSQPLTSTSTSTPTQTQSKGNYNVYDRALLYEDYKTMIEGYKFKKKNMKACPNCNIDKILIYSEGLYACTNCGEVESCIIESEINNYKDPMVDKPTFPYKRKNHFCEWLSQFQAKESIEISCTIIDAVKSEMRKQRINNIDFTKGDTVKKILKKLKLNAYYEHIIYIISKITGKSAPYINRETEDILKKMFDEIQLPFEKHCPKDRINFLSYSYVLHKFFQLLGLDEYVKCFPLLKSRQKLRIQDDIWKNICMECKWVFYPSV